MVTISTENNYITVVNVFTVEPAMADRLIEIAYTTTNEVISRSPGFVSANFHKSLDGKHVVNYAQWESMEALQNSMQLPAVHQMLGQMSAIATSAPGLYHVVKVVEKP